MAQQGLKPHLVRGFKVSRDPQFVDKLEDIVGLYLWPPEHALVLCCDEKCQVQALDRTQPGLPMKTGRAATMTHDYKRNGTTTLFAALNVLNGHVIGQCQRRHTHVEWLKFLRQINRETPKGKTLHLIADNDATHKHPAVQEWLAKHPRLNMHFTPTSASWLNMVERFLRDLTVNRLRRGVFTSVPELVTAIDEHVAHHNIKPKPFIWTKTADDIVQKVIRANSRLRMQHCARAGRQGDGERTAQGDDAQQRRSRARCDEHLLRAGAGFQDAQLYDISAGTSLRITPSVIGAAGPGTAAEKDMVRLLIKIEDGGLTGNNIGQLPVVQRTTINTQSLVVEGSTLLIAGYAQERESRNQNGVPGLQHVPVIGNLFKSSDKNRSRVERLFMITPRVVDLQGAEKAPAAPMMPSVQEVPVTPAPPPSPLPATPPPPAPLPAAPPPPAPQTQPAAQPSRVQRSAQAAAALGLAAPASAAIASPLPDPSWLPLSTPPKRKRVSP